MNGRVPGTSEGVNSSAGPQASRGSSATEVKGISDNRSDTCQRKDLGSALAHVRPADPRRPTGALGWPGATYRTGCCKPASGPVLGASATGHSRSGKADMTFRAQEGTLDAAPCAGAACSVAMTDMTGLRSVV